MAKNAQSKKMKPHMMYSKTGKGQMVYTKKKHLELKKKGYSHTKPKKKDSYYCIASNSRNRYR